MKKAIIAIFFFYTSIASGQSDTLSILLIGDSYLYFNSVDSVLSKLLNSQINNSIKFKITLSAFPGLRLKRHADEAYITVDSDPRSGEIFKINRTIDLLKKQTWDYVIAQGELGLRQNTFAEEFLVPIKIIKSMTKPNCKLMVIIPNDQNSRFPKSLCSYITTKKEIVCRNFDNIESELDSINKQFKISESIDFEIIHEFETMLDISKVIPDSTFTEPDGHPTKQGAFLIAYLCFEKIIHSLSKEIKFEPILTKEEYQIIDIIQTKHK